MTVKTYKIIPLLIYTLFFLVPINANGQPSHPSEQEIIRLENTAEKERHFASEAERQVIDLRDYAREAREFARTRQDPTEQADWETTATRYETQAAELEEEAAELRTSADQKQARARELRRVLESLPTPMPIPKETKHKKASPYTEELDEVIPVEAILGFWRNTENDAPILIEQKDPEVEAFKHKLTLRTEKHVWEGRFSSAETPEPSRLHFTKKPRAEEMNPYIPLWVRKSIEGQVEWHLELNKTDSCPLSTSLEGQWYPGEVGWQGTDSEKGNAWVVGRGRPIQLNYDYMPEDIELETWKRSFVDIKVSQNQAFADWVEYLLKGQPFFIEVWLPEELAEEQGPNMEVVVRAESSKKTATVDLQAAAARRKSVRYYHNEPVSIDDIGAEADREALLPLIPGIRIPLIVDNAETVVFSFGDAQRAVTIYNSWVQAGLARNEEGFAVQEAIFSAVAQDQSKPQSVRDVAQKRLQMINNARQIIGYVEKKDFLAHRFYNEVEERTPDYVAYYIGELYLNSDPRHGLLGSEASDQPSPPLLFDPEIKWYGEGEELPIQFRDAWGKFGVKWTSYEEAERVHHVIAERREELRGEAFRDLLRVISFPMYSTLAGITGAEDIAILIFSHDAFGRRVSVQEKFIAAVGLTTQVLTLGLATHFNYTHSTSANRINRLGRRIRSTNRVQLTNSRQIAGLRGSSGEPRRARSTNSKWEEAEIHCARTGSSPSGSEGSNRALSRKDVDTLYRMYGPSARFKDVGDALTKFYKRYNSTCELNSILLHHETATGKYISETEAATITKRLGIHDPGIDDPDLIAGGWTSAIAMDFVSRVLNGSAWPKHITLKQMSELMSQGYLIVNRFYITGRAGHSVALLNIRFRADGKAVRVRFFDPDFGAVIEVAAAKYCELLSPGTFKEFNDKIVVTPSNSLILDFQ